MPDEANRSAPVILLATPCFGGLVHQSYMLSVCKLMACAASHGFALDLALLGSDALITRSRSVLVARFLDMPQATHLLFVDADIAFEPEQVLRLLRFDEEFVAAFYPLKSVDWDALPRRAIAGEPLQGAGLTYVGTLLEPPERQTRDGFATAQYAGTGFQLIRRSVFETLIAAHPELHFKSVHTIAREAPRSDNLYALFDCQIDPQTGAYLSEDYAFCRRWRSLGGTIWLDLESTLTHVGADHFRGDTTRRFANVGRGERPGDEP